MTPTEVHIETVTRSDGLPFDQIRIRLADLWFRADCLCDRDVRLARRLAREAECPLFDKRGEAE